ncbi:MAG: glycosyl hydrolase 108 family protein [Hyphomicrobiales bacterium]|nr:glycosyl hydrolase 108 family protein [Hyphomicrobiales bacterium]
MKDTFPAALKHVLKFEGGYSDHPLDPGGATNLGVTKATLERFRGRRVTKAEVRALKHAEAAAIYRKFYWDQVQGDALPPGLDLAVFDCAVNQGPARARKWLQQAAKARADGVIGPRTLAAVKAADARALLLEFMALRMRHYGSLARLFTAFGLGWSRRLMATLAEALAAQRPKHSTPKPPIGKTGAH